MRKQNTKKNYIWRSWIIVAVCIIFITCFIFLFYLYNTIQTGKKDGFDQTKDYILANTELVHIETIEPFYEKDTFHIVFGETDDLEQKIVFVNISDDKHDVITVNQSEIVPKDKVLQQLQSKCQNCKIFNVKPAMIEQNPLWEITYRDEHNRYIFDYFSFVDGSRYERLQLKQMFK